MVGADGATVVDGTTVTVDVVCSEQLPLFTVTRNCVVEVMVLIMSAESRSVVL